ncbi:sulfatase family protein [Halobaculum sp. P14]|uniref:sulfatase family protein n=1 Tax=Halobaculum sp. P14 TaxID=3421638 RepID=UPI003EB82B13
MAGYMSERARPNVVFILCDQMRRQAMSCAGDPNVSTPNLDRLAENGARFTNASATAPICVPSRFSILTGQHPHTRNAHHHWRMSPEERTYGHEFSDSGYETGYVGKWHLADVGRDRPVPEHLQGGFTHWRGFELKNEPFDTSYYVDGDPEPHSIDTFQTDGIFDLGREFIDDHQSDDDPFCLTLSVEPPHPPFIAPESNLERWEDRPLELRPNVPYPDAEPPDKITGDQYEQWGNPEESTDELYEEYPYHGETVFEEMRKYYAMVENLDENVGKLLDELERRGIRDETAVVFSSDHGELLGSHGRMMKQHPYEESVGIPLIVSYPDAGIDSGAEIHEPVCTEDFLPTLLGLAGLEPESELPGVDLTPLLRGERESLDRDGVLLEFVREIRPSQPYHDETWRGFRTERYKYTVKGFDSLSPGAFTSGGEPWQLYDLKADPYEQHNLVDDPEYEDVAAEMHGKLRDAISQYDDDYGLEAAFGWEELNKPDT